MRSVLPTGLQTPIDNRSKLRVLYIVHSTGVTGGGLLSLGYFLSKIDRSRVQPVVALIHASRDLIDYFRALDVEVVSWGGITDFPHTMAGGWDRLYTPLGMFRFVRRVVPFIRSIRSSRDLLAAVRPDIVHLNSLVLSASAIASRRAGYRTLWHVREAVAGGSLGVRRAILRYVFRRCADESIFISNFDRSQLDRAGIGTVVREFVDFEKFDRSLQKADCRKELGISISAKVVLFMGGTMEAKGGARASS